MKSEQAETVFEQHRLVNDWHKITERENTIRYTLETQIRYYNEYHFDWDWLEIKEVVSTQIEKQERLGYTDRRGLIAKMLFPDPGEKLFNALLFVVEVEK